MRDPKEPIITGVVKQVADLYLPPLLRRVDALSLQVAERFGRVEIEPSDVFTAFEETIGRKSSERISRGGRWLEANFSGFMIITAILAIIFGYMGLSDTGNKGYGEIAKIFAGALAGSAASAMQRGRVSRD